MSFAHDGLDRMTGVLEGALGSGVSLATIAYDNRGQRASMTRRGGDSTSYGFDGVSRLKTLADTFAGGSGNSTSTFGYNLASQITGLTRSNDSYAYTPSNQSKSYAVNGLNQYTAVSGATQSHDANGNLTSDGTTSYTYDVENRMVGASNGASLTYDPMGRLFQTTGTGTGTTQFLYDGDELVAEYNGSGALTRRYVHGAAVDDPLAWYEGAGLTAARFLHTDHQGSITGIANASGGLVNINRYDEYGVPSSSNIGRFGYTGQTWLPEVGRWHYKSRTYNARDGRFDQVDTVGYKGAMNLYEYADSNPVNMVDSGGQTPAPAAKYAWNVSKAIWNSLSPERKEQIARTIEAVGLTADVVTLATGLGSGPESTLASKAVAAQIRTSIRGQLGLRAQLFGQQISRGHAWGKHGHKFQALGIKNQSQFGKYIEKTIAEAKDVRSAGDGRKFYLDHENQSVIITSPKHEGTAFRPDDWADYLPTRVPSAK